MDGGKGRAEVVANVDSCNAVLQRKPCKYFSFAF